MRRALFYSPILFLERLAEWSRDRQRLRRVRRLGLSGFTLDHIDSLEILQGLAAQRCRTVFDVGANIGDWTRLCRAVMPGTVVHAFEPFARHAEAYRRATRDFTAVHLHEVALGEIRAVGTLKVTNFSDASSLLPLAQEGARRWRIKVSEEVPVPVERLDDLVLAKNLPAPDFIKLDVQGFELAALRGAIETLRTTRWVMAEVSLRHFYEGQCLFSELAGFLAAQGFEVVDFGRSIHRRPLREQFDVLWEKCKDESLRDLVS